MYKIWYGDFMLKYNSLISKSLGKYESFCKGKMIRGNMICISGNMMKDKLTSKTLKFATQMELLHNATLLHDDVLDNETIRRNKPSLNTTLGNKYSILLGDCMLADISYEIACLENVEVVKNMALILKSFGKGEIEDTDYFEKVKNKTALFFAYILKSTLILEDIKDEELIDKMFNFGLNYGYYYQLVDDVLDSENDAKNNMLNITKFENNQQILHRIHYHYNMCKSILESIDNSVTLEQYIDSIDIDLNYKHKLIIT